MAILHGSTSLLKKYKIFYEKVLTLLCIVDIILLVPRDWRETQITKSGDYSLKVTPVPIPNTMVKLQHADGTAWVTVWESKSLPGNMIH